MRVYVAHSRDFDFKGQLYTPIRTSHLNLMHQIVMPHEFSDNATNSKEAMRRYDVIIAECSFPSTGLGIELGWADMLDKPILAIHMVGKPLGKSILATTRHRFEYNSPAHMVRGISQFLNHK